MSEPEVARELLRQLDLALYPWGEPGVVPTADGKYWGLAWEGGPLKRAFVEHGIARWSATGNAVCGYTWQRFRKR